MTARARTIAFALIAAGPLLACFAGTAGAQEQPRLEQRTVEMPFGTVTILGLTDFVDLAAVQVEEGIPILEDLLGLDVPDGLDIVLTQTGTDPGSYSAGAWFYAGEGQIDVPAGADQHRILHELAHLWLGYETFDVEWADEGLADLYASEAMRRMGATPPVPTVPDRDAPDAHPLNAWDRPVSIADESPGRERFMHQASWWLFSQIADEVGIDAVGEVVRTAAADGLSFAVPGEQVTFRQAWYQWGYLLDLLTRQAGSELAEPLFREHVAQAAELEQLAQRSRSHAAYDELLESGPGWVPPKAVRVALTRWDFEVADRLMGMVGRSEHLLDQLTRELRALGIELPEAVRTEWEGAGSIGGLERALSERLDAALAVSAAEAARDDAGPLGRVGLAFGPVDADLDAARAQLGGADPTAARVLAEDVRNALDDADRTGAARVASLLAIVVVGLALQRSGLRPPAGALRRVALAPPRAGLATARAAWRVRPRGRSGHEVEAVAEVPSVDEGPTELELASLDGGRRRRLRPS